MKFPAHLVQMHFSSPLGPMILAASDVGLVMTWFDDQEGIADDLLHAPHGAADHPVLHHANRQFKEYFDGQREHFDLPLDLSPGTAFQRDVWHALLGIPFGHTCSYGQIASQIGRGDAVRAVGAAVGSNPLGIIVPCHRVIGANGSLTGYAGGLERKTWLLQLESGHNPQGSLI